MVTGWRPGRLTSLPIDCPGLQYEHVVAASSPIHCHLHRSGGGEASVGATAATV